MTTTLHSPDASPAPLAPSSLAPSSDASASEHRQPRILLVEDTFETSEMIKLFLRSIGEVHHATDAESALAMTAADSAPYDVILMDINLGRGMSGLDVTRHLRQLDAYASAPIIALTAYAMKGDREEMIAAGCTDYLSKPFSKQDLLATLAKYL